MVRGVCVVLVQCELYLCNINRLDIAEDILWISQSTKIVGLYLVKTGAVWIRTQVPCVWVKRSPNWTIITYSPIGCRWHMKCDCLLTTCAYLSTSQQSGTVQRCLNVLQSNEMRSVAALRWWRHNDCMYGPHLYNLSSIVIMFLQDDQCIQYVLPKVDGVHCRLSCPPSTASQLSGSRTLLVTRHVVDV